MKLIIDRGMNKENFYSVEFGPDFDILIFTAQFFIPSINKEDMVEVDKIITNSFDKVFCVLYLKHPLLMKDYSVSQSNKSFFLKDESEFRNILRDYFAVRLKYRHYPVELYEFGRRLFNS